MNKRASEIIRFVLTGGVCFLIEAASLWVLKTWLHMPATLGTPIAFLISVAFNYLLCVRWVFPRSQTGSRKAQIGFLITSVMGLVLNTVLMWLLTVLFGEDTVLLTVMGFSLQVYLVNKAVATLLVMVWNYFTKRLVLKG